MEGVLSRPVLVLLAWGIAGLLWWDRRRRVIGPVLIPFTLTAMALIVVAMALTLAAVPAPPLDRLVQAVLMIESAYGFVAIARRSRSSGDRER